MTEVKEATRTFEVNPDEARDIISDPYAYAKSKGMNPGNLPLNVTLQYVPTKPSEAAGERKLKIKWHITVHLEIGSE